MIINIFNYNILIYMTTTNIKNYDISVLQDKFANLSITNNTDTKQTIQSIKHEKIIIKKPIINLDNEPNITLNTNNDKQLSKKDIILPILEPCSIPDFINIETLKTYVKKDIEGNNEYFDDLNITYKISDPKKAEWILNKAITNGKLIGNGNTNADIQVGDKTLIDVSVLTLNGNHTNEKSIIQNFLSGYNLDSLFKDEKGDDIVKLFKEKLIDKYKNCDNKDIYYMVFICKGKNVYITTLKLNQKNINNMEFDQFINVASKNGKKYEPKNIIVANFINKQYGNVRLYKSKKRLELRLNKDIINNTCSSKLY